MYAVLKQYTMYSIEALLGQCTMVCGGGVTISHVCGVYFCRCVLVVWRQFSASIVAVVGCIYLLLYGCVATILWQCWESVVSVL
jgi:hypothetical protein